jgi:hypothetical protein
MQASKKNQAEKMVMPKFPKSFHIEADRVGANISVCVGGVISILDFSEMGAILKVRGGKIKICGASLSVAVYENNIAEVCGKVFGIEFV